MVAGRRFVRSVSETVARTGLVLALVACRGEPTSSSPAVAVEASLAGAPEITVGERVDPAPSFVVRDAEGRELANLPVSISITEGNGTLLNAATRTSVGPTPIGNWVLDTIAGVNAVTILAGSAPPVVITMRGVPGAPTRIQVTGADQSALAGDRLSEPLFIKVVDRFGNSIPGIDVSVSVDKGGGQVVPRTFVTAGTTGATGVAWTLGRAGGRQTTIAQAAGLSATIGAVVRSDFAPVIRLSGAVSPAFESAVLAAGDRLQAIITGDLLDIPVHNFDVSRCGVQAETLNELVDDVVIYAHVAPIDGVGNVIASAGPCVSRTQSRLPVIGVLRVDVADIPTLEANGHLDAVILHEMLHVLGVGTLWESRNLLSGFGGTDPRFSGALAAGQCLAAGGSAACADQRVPVENTGGAGTAYSHWRESVFDNEVMTGYIETSGDMPLSRMTVASLEDVGFTVNLFAADAWQLMVADIVSPRLAPSVRAPWETTASPPAFEVTPDGWVRPLSGIGAGRPDSNLR